MNERLKELSSKMSRKQKIESALYDLEARKKDLYSRIHDLQLAFEKEEQDVSKLENFSLYGLFFSLIGMKDEELEKERREAYAALAKVQTAERELEAVKYEIAKYESELKTLEGCEEEYHNLLDERMDIIANSSAINSEDRLLLEEKINYLSSQEKEINEAINAGRYALKIIEDIKRSLSSAKNWSVLDMMGGDFISTLAKHNKMNNAQDGIYSLQRALTHFKAELTDITVDTDIEIVTNDFLSFADLWFDGLFADMMVHERINQTISQVDRTQNQIKYVISKLEEQLKETGVEKRKISKLL